MTRFELDLICLSDVELAQLLGRLMIDGTKEQIDAVTSEFDTRRLFREWRLD